MTNSSSDYSYFMSHILPVYKRANIWDDNLCLVAQGLCGVQYTWNVQKKKVICGHIVGSCSDGACSPRMYRAPPVLEVDILVLLPVPDREGVYGETPTFIDGTSGQPAQPHPDKVGVFMLTGTSRQEYWDGYATKHPHILNTPFAESPKHYCDAYLKAREVLNSNPLYIPKWIKEGCIHSTKGPSIKQFRIHYNTHIHVDTVKAHHVQGWPREAVEWRTRARLWPSASVVEKVLQQGYQIVRKLSSSTGDIDGPVEYHTTFAMCERYLAKQRTPVQKLVYLMAKTLFYTYLDIHDDGNPNIDFPSYALKTCMMWLMEQTPVDRWTEDNILGQLRELLTHLKMSAGNGILKNYFMIGANVLSNCTPNLLERVRVKISWILSDMNKCLQETALYRGNVLLYGYSVMKGGIKAYDTLMYRCQNEVMGYGLLQAIKKVYQVRDTYRCILKVLEKGTGEGLKAKGYLFDEEECFHILKAMMNIFSAAYMKGGDYKLSQVEILGRYQLNMHDLVKKVLCLDQHLPEPEVTILRLYVQWQDGLGIVRGTSGCGNRYEEVKTCLKYTGEWKNKMLQGIKRFPGQVDMIVVREGSDINVYKWSDIGDLIEHCARDLQENEADRWMPQIYSLTHRDIPEVQLMDFARMLYLLYVCDDKIN